MKRGKMDLIKKYGRLGMIVSELMLLSIYIVELDSRVRHRPSTGNN